MQGCGCQWSCSQQCHRQCPSLTSCSHLPAVLCLQGCSLPHVSLQLGDRCRWKQLPGLHQQHHHACRVISRRSFDIMQHRLNQQASPQGSAMLQM